MVAKGWPCLYLLKMSFKEVIVISTYISTDKRKGHANNI